MTNLEDDLREALRRKEPDEALLTRVLRRIPDEQRGRRRTVLVWAAAAAIVGAIGGGIQYSAVERARGEAAAAQVREALRITGSKLSVVQAKFKEIGS
jgi:alkylhydroperoxidase family enzyme